MVKRAAVVVGVVARGPRRAFAIGFVGFAVGYLLFVKQVTRPLPGIKLPNELVYALHNNELPTTVALRYLYHALAEYRAFDLTTFQEVLEFDPPEPYAGTIMTKTGPLAIFPVPPAKTFASVGHTWWALFLGYLGGQFARFVFLRRVKEQE
jgi:hypothetical protein